MITIIGVRFRNVGKVYYFSPRELDICVGDHVIVETARGVEYGFVVLGPKEVDDSKVIQPLKEVIRIATPKDDAREESNRKKEKEAFEICQKKIRAASQCHGDYNSLFHSAGKLMWVITESGTWDSNHFQHSLCFFFCFFF